MAIDLAPMADPSICKSGNYWKRKREELSEQQDKRLAEDFVFEDFNPNFKRLTTVKFDFDYAIFVKGDVKDLQKSIVYQQLLQINEEFQRVNKLLYIDIEVF